MEKETYNNDGIECPYCGYVEDDSEVKYDIEEELEKFDCPHCGKSLNATHNILHSWEASVRTKEWLEKDITREESNLKRAKEINPNCIHFFKEYEGRIKELKEELKKLSNSND